MKTKTERIHRWTQINTDKDMNKTDSGREPCFARPNRAKNPRRLGVVARKLFLFRFGLSVFICVHLWFQIPASAAQTLTGIDVLEAQKFAPLIGKRVALITNQTGID